MFKPQLMQHDQLCKCARNFSCKFIVWQIENIQLRRFGNWAWYWWAQAISVCSKYFQLDKVSNTSRCATSQRILTKIKFTQSTRTKGWYRARKIVSIKAARDSNRQFRRLHSQSGGNGSHVCISTYWASSRLIASTKFGIWPSRSFSCSLSDNIILGRMVV